MNLFTEETSTWIPLTIQNAKESIIPIQSAFKEFLYGVDGKEYIDGISSWWTCIHGHRHPEIMQAIQRQTEVLDHVMLAGFLHEPAESLSKKILNQAGGNYKKVFYSDNGSNAVEIALKLAIQYYKNRDGEKSGRHRSKFIVFSSSYHGDSIGGMNVSGITYFNRIFAELRFPVFEIDAPNPSGFSSDEEISAYYADILSRVKNTILENPDEYAGVVIEPLVFGATGMVFYDAEFLRGLKKITNELDVLLIFDEVFTGMGRTGEYFAFQKADAVPDLVAFAKGLTGGSLPLAATLVTEKIYNAFLTEDPYKSFFHAHTMTGNPLACSAGLASIGILEKEGLDQVKKLEISFRKRMEELVLLHPDNILNPRVLGGIFAFELNQKIGEDEYLNPIGKKLRAKLLEKNILLRPLGNTVYITPPYNISDSSLDRIFSALEQAIGSI
ncbi:adenosylmethionine--8-amino-7-oxononanoate aminotransferase BioA [Leptospira kobayashii]|uniref:Adenosylmethionine-8-amino-7-oxononanoate aminotransferase n=1 Tax=Leptospira kobayashii TaxID=1917830 RepID=A0ABN6KFC5_9LEPT|nr:adenosylmethionine--8-amino-7-oxononanoate transaminase [Leptospira kobayashii]BDA79798.1 adenosylmethionine--8-amino-7-oxononanoate aminotransferase BioA [Leptospira kobayashii]